MAHHQVSDEGGLQTWRVAANKVEKRVIKLTVVIIEAYHCCQLHATFYPTFLSLG
jgi:hypothetical protein